MLNKTALLSMIGVGLAALADRAVSFELPSTASSAVSRPEVGRARHGLLLRLDDRKQVKQPVHATEALSLFDVPEPASVPVMALALTGTAALAISLAAGRRRRAVRPYTGSQGL